MTNLKDQLIHSIKRSTQYIEKNLVAIGFVGLVGFPTYYIIWKYLFPQPYENVLLRAIGCGLFLPFVLIKFWPEKIRKFLAVYWVSTLIYALPFFFTYMTLMNEASAVWGMSSIAAITLLFIVIDDWLLINLLFFIGTFLAWIFYYFTTNVSNIPSGYIEQIPIYLFTLIAGSIFSHKSELLRQERQRIMLSVGSSIAHELRTPLLGIKSGMHGLRKHLPKLISTYQTAQKNNLDIPTIRPAHLQALDSLIDRVEDETNFSNSIIDTLLMNSGNINIDKTKFSTHSINHCIGMALERYPYQPSEAKQLVNFEPGDDFKFTGDDILYVHVIFNLIKNALDAIYEAGKGEITISTQNGNGTGKNFVSFRDTGKGIAPANLSHIFDQFYTTAPHGKGSGIGLSFCRHVMKCFDGEMYAVSEAGEFTEFTMVFKEL